MSRKDSSPVTLLIVEAPGKVKTISQYVGPEYKVLATYGHVRSLPSKSGSVLPDKDFALTWDMLSKASKAVDSIDKVAGQVNRIILATDLDREGEAISWHLLEHLRANKILRPDCQIQRVSFNAITKNAILSALKEPRSIDQHLVEAYLARLALDYLVGFTLSPVLWKKVPGTRSAGRVQSVALRLVVEREQAIRSFEVQEYWSIHGTFEQHDHTQFSAHLTHYEGEKIDKYTIAQGDQAREWTEVLSKQSYEITDIQAKKTQRHPPPPFITSSLQQEASRKLGLSPSRTMQLAQKLYEGAEVNGQSSGLITYMRTDSPMIVPEVIKDIRTYIQSQWGGDSVSPQVRQYKTKAHSQEAHEAIRPTNVQWTPTMLKNQGILDPDALRLYQLIWDRTVASQMSSAVYDQTTAVISDPQQRYILRATGSVLVFAGFLALYGESTDDDSNSGADEEKLPVLHLNKPLIQRSMVPSQHFTQPPARYSEASLIKAMEELGIGRPSTYARIVQVLQEREYVAMDKKRMVPTELGMVLVAFLCAYFDRYVDYHFTAALEAQLDDVSEGKLPWKQVLRDFWDPFYQTIQSCQDLTVAQVLEHIQKDVIAQTESCPQCSQGTLSLKLGKMGPFLACSAYPECTYSATTQGENQGPRVLGSHPSTHTDILVKKGPYGWYVEHGTVRTSLGSWFDPETLTLAQGVWLVSLPHELGLHPETQEPITMGLGRFGPYLKYQSRFFSIKKNTPPEDIDLASAVSYIQQQASQPARPASSKRATVSASKKAPSSRSTATKPAAAKSTKSSSKPTTTTSKRTTSVTSSKSKPKSPTS